MGRGIGTRVVAGGHQVEIVDRDPAEAQQLAEDLGGSAAALDPGSRFGGEVVVFAVYYPGIKDAVGQYGDQLAGRVVVDITNPVDTQSWDRLATPPGTSSAEEVQQLAPQGTPVVKAFNTTFAGTLVPVRSVASSSTSSSPVTMRPPSSRCRSSSPTVVPAHRRRPTQSRPAARAARLPPHLAPAAARPRIQQRHQVRHAKTRAGLQDDRMTIC